MGGAVMGVPADVGESLVPHTVTDGCDVAEEEQGKGGGK